MCNSPSARSMLSFDNVDIGELFSKVWLAGAGGLSDLRKGN